MNTAKDNFTKITGINKAIQYLLNDAKILTYKDLSNTPVEKITWATSKINPVYRESWPSQALLASKNRWDKLFEYQYHLKNCTGPCRKNNMHNFNLELPSFDPEKLLMEINN